MDGQGIAFVNLMQTVVLRLRRGMTIYVLGAYALGKHLWDGDLGGWRWKRRRVIKSRVDEVDLSPVWHFFP
jgi:hypothetical protein